MEATRRFLFGLFFLRRNGESDACLSRSSEAICTCVIYFWRSNGREELCGDRWTIALTCIRNPESK